MEPTTIILTGVISTSVTLLVKAIWDWASNKNGKKEFDEIKALIQEQRDDFTALRDSLLLEYIRKADFDEVKRTLYQVRDIAMSNKNNIEMGKESTKQNVERMTVLENRFNECALRHKSE